MLKKWLVWSTLFALFVVVPISFALEETSGDRVVVAKGDVIEGDYYVGANELIIDGTITGDLIFGASKAEINGVVEGDVLGGAGELIINGTVMDDVRVGASGVTINGEVQGDVLVGSYAFHLAPSARIGEDIFMGAYSAILEGTIGRDASVGALGVRLGGTVQRNLQLSVGSATDSPPVDPLMFMPNKPSIEIVAPGLAIVGEPAVGGDFSYEADAPTNIEGIAVGGETSFQQDMDEMVAKPEEKSLASTLVTTLWQGAQRLLVILLIGWLLWRFLPEWGNGAVTNLQAKPVPSLVWGGLWIIAWPILLVVALTVIILLAVLLGAVKLGTVGGILTGLGIVGIGAELTLYWLTLAFIGKAIVGYWLGGQLLGQDKPLLLRLLVGVVPLLLLGMIPVIGSLVSFVINALALGGIWLYWKDDRRHRPIAKTPELSLG